MNARTWIAVAGLLAASACRSGSAPRADAVGGEREAMQATTNRTWSSGSLSDLGDSAGDYPVAWREPGFEQRYTGVNFETVRVIDSVVDAGRNRTSVTHESRAEGFWVLHIACAGRDRYAVFGATKPRKEPVVELWDLVPDPNGATESPDLVAKTFRKTRIFEGEPDHGAVAFEYDPDGRYVVCAIRDPRGEVALVQVDARDRNVPPRVLHDSTAIPVLKDVLYAQKADHKVLGRVFRFGTSFETDRRILLIDANDDGTFDGAPLVGDDDFFEAAGLDAYEDWVSLDR